MHLFFTTNDTFVYILKRQVNICPHKFWNVPPYASNNESLKCRIFTSIIIIIFQIQNNKLAIIIAVQHSFEVVIIAFLNTMNDYTTSADIECGDSNCNCSMFTLILICICRVFDTCLLFFRKMPDECVDCIVLPAFV